MSVKFYRPPTKRALAAHLVVYHRDAIAHLAPSLGTDPDPDRILGLALKPFPKADLDALHQLVHLGRQA